MIWLLLGLAIFNLFLVFYVLSHLLSPDKSQVIQNEPASPMDEMYRQNKPYFDAIMLASAPAGSTPLLPNGKKHDHEIVEVGNKDCIHSFVQIGWDKKYGNDVDVCDDKWYAIYKDLFECTKCGCRSIKKCKSLL